MKSFRRHLDLQAKISLVLVAVILPTFLIVTVAENQFTLPILEEEVKQIGINSGKTLAAEIDSSRILSLPNPGPALENSLQEILNTQPNIVRIDIVSKDPATGTVKLLASNMDDDPSNPSPIPPMVETVTSEYRSEESGGGGLWDILVPIEHRSRDPKGPRKLIGTVHLMISTKLVIRIVGTLGKMTATAAGFSVVSLILVLSYFLRKTIENDRKLKKAESHNLQLTEQLHDIQRQLMNTEKLAVMGQLTASFAHEIGTPLNAIGGHLQLLKEEISDRPPGAPEERLEIVNGQLAKIEQIVKDFLQSTSKPPSQKQLVDLNQLVDRTISIVTPRTELLQVKVKRQMDRNMGPLRVVPLEIEQVLLNLLNNSLDSIATDTRKKGRFELELSTEIVSDKGKEWAQVSVYDTGAGIRKVDLPNVLKPFFTTKSPGEGTGLGLTICQQLVHKYGGHLTIDSKEGVWTRVTMRLPYSTVL